MESAIIITIKKADQLTDEGAAALASWMLQQSRWLRKHHGELAPTFQQRFWVAKSCKWFYKK